MFLIRNIVLELFGSKDNWCVFRYREESYEFQQKKNMQTIYEHKNLEELLWRPHGTAYSYMAAKSSIDMLKFSAENR